MFAVVYWSGLGSDSGLIVYGTFATSVEAETWIGARLDKSNLYIVQVFSPPPYVPPATGGPVSFTVGKFVAVCVVFSANGGVTIWVYGPWSTEVEAQAWIAGRPYPGGCSTAQVIAKPV